MTASTSQPYHTPLAPMDDSNRALLENVRPTEWNNPTPSGRYNLVVIGAGAAGLVTTAIAAGLGAKVALVERNCMGGDCLNVGCVPSKAILRAANAWAAASRGKEFGLLDSTNARPDFPTVMARMRQLRARISRVDSVRRYQTLGADVFLGHGRFADGQTLKVEGQSLRFARAAICTGARAAAPPIPGLPDSGYLTNETVFYLTALPPRLAVIGAGPIGCELAQAFARFGSRVTLFEQANRILPREDPDAAQLVHEHMRHDGVHIELNAEITQVERRGTETVVSLKDSGPPREYTADELLVGAGRAPNVEGLGLDHVGVAYDNRVGVHVNDRLQTTNPRLFAAGDICFPLKFTHVADALAQIVIQNALFPHPFGLGYASTGSLVIPRCTYTQPEIATVGLTAQEADTQGIRIDSYTHYLGDVDRAVLDGDEDGFARIHVKQGTDRIVGATLVAPHAGEMINEITLAMKQGLGLGALAGTIHPYPTQAEVIKKAANAWRKTTLTPRKQALLRRLFAWTR